MRNIRNVKKNLFFSDFNDMSRRVVSGSEKNHQSKRLRVAIDR